MQWTWISAYYTLINPLLHRWNVFSHISILICVEGITQHTHSKGSVWVLLLFYSSARQDMRPLEVFSGLYKGAAILHFPVSAVPAKLVSTDCGGSGRGLPADACLHIFLEFSPISEWFLLSRTQGDGLAVLTRVGFNIQTIGSTQFLTLFLVRLSVNASRNGDCCCVRAGRGMLLPQLAHRLHSRHIFGICQPPPNGNMPYFTDGDLLKNGVYVE